MKVLALGGAGAMGRRAVRTALDFAFVKELVVADLSRSAAEHVAKQAGSRARAIALDVRDERALAEQLAGADVVLNSAGPFYRFGVPILRAAIAARTHYLDINDDWEPTLDMLELDPAAREAEVTAIVGMGASPGVSNLLAVAAARELDEVDELVTGWGLGGDGETSELETLDRDAPPSAAVVHWMHQCSGTIRVLHGGGFVDVKPVQEVEIDFPGIGTGSAWTVGHPEAVTLPRSFPGLRECVNVMALPRWIADALAGLAAEIDAGRLSEEQAARRILAGAHPPATGSPGEVTLPPLFALARGRRQGRPCSVGARVRGAPSGGMAGATGVPLALGLEFLACGAIPARGVFAPEAVVDPDAFFDALATRCEPAFSRGAELVAVQASS